MLRCLLNDKQYENTCSGAKPFRTGTPFCGHHLRDIFGVDFNYTRDQIFPNLKTECYGPLLSSAPEIVHAKDTVIFPHRTLFDMACKNVVSDLPVNTCTLNYIKRISCDTKIAPLYKTYIKEVLRNWLEYEIDVNDVGLRRQIEANILEWKTDLTGYSNNVILPEPDYVSQMIGGKDKQLPISRKPFFVQYLSMHMIPAIMSHEQYEHVDYMPQTCLSNIVYSPAGFVSERDLVHKDYFILAAESKKHVIDLLKHSRKTVQSDYQTLQNMADLASKAHPFPGKSLL